MLRPTNHHNGPGLERRVVLKRFAVVLVVSGAIAAIGAPVASAGHVPYHQHFIIPPSGERHEIGPTYCENANVHRGFGEFHQNVHLGQARDAFNKPQNPVEFQSRHGCPTPPTP